MLNGIVSAPRKLHKSRHPIVVAGIPHEFFPVIQREPLHVEIPDVKIFEPVLLIAPHALPAHLRHQVVEFERLPDIEEVVELLEIGDMVLLQPDDRVALP